MCSFALTGLAAMPWQDLDLNFSRPDMWTANAPMEPCSPGDPGFSFLMLCQLLIGLARFDLQNFAVGHSLGVAMQTAQFWTVLIMLVTRQLGHPPSNGGCCLQRIGRLQAEHTG